MSGSFGTRDLTGHWVKIRVDTDPPLPEKGIFDLAIDSMVRDMGKPPWWLRINQVEPWEHALYRQALQQEENRARRAAGEWGAVARVEDADRRYAQYLERHFHPAVKAVRRIHDWAPADGTCTGCRSSLYDEDGNEWDAGEDWPCPTIQAVLEAVWA